MPKVPPPYFRPKGSDNAHARLHERDIPVIRRRARRGESAKDIAQAYQVSERTIYRVKSGRTWSHVRDETS